MGNSAVNFVDLIGTKKLNFRVVLEEEDQLDDAVKRAGGVGFSSFSDMIKDLEEKVKPYREDGKDPCNCINRIDIYTHGNEGVIMLPGGSSFTGDDLKDFREKKGKTRGDPKFDQHILDLQKLSGLMCKNGTLDFHSCQAGLGDKGGTLHDELRKIFPDQKVVLHRGTCYTNWGGKLDWDSNWPPFPKKKRKGGPSIPKAM